MKKGYLPRRRPFFLDCRDRFSFVHWLFD